MSGTPNQIEFAEQIKSRVNAEFDRVAEVFRAVARTQAGQDRIDTVAIIQILEEKRTEVMANEQAGYFIKDLAGIDRSGSSDDRPGYPLPHD